MSNTIVTLKIIHRIALISVLLLVTTISLLANISPVTAFVFLPFLLIVLFTMSVFIEQSLNSLVLKDNSITTRKNCLIKSCLHRNCLD